jgi:hypothetical protein
MKYYLSDEMMKYESFVSFETNGKTLREKITFVFNLKNILLIFLH